MTDTQTETSSRQHIRLVWGAAFLCGLAVSYNSGAIMASTPFIRADLDLDSNTLQWVMISYLIVATGLVGVMGGFADIFGRLRVLSFGAAMFALGSLVCLMASDASVILAGRAVQGIGGGAIFGTGVAVLTVATPESQRGFALGLWSASVALGTGTGPLIGGVLTGLIDWRAIFAFDILILVAALVGCYKVARARLVPEDASPDSSIDFLGAGLMMVSLGCLTLALSRGQVDGWTSTVILLLLLASAIGIAAFIVWELRAKRPLFELRFFRRLGYVASAYGMFVAGSAMFGLLFYYNLFVQAPAGFHYSALVAGLSLLPCMALFLGGSLGLPRLLAKVDEHWPATIGMISLTAGFWLLHDVSITSSYAEIWLPLALIGAGLGSTFALLPRAALRELPDADAGQGSGVINASLYVGFTFGIAAAGVVASTIHYRAVAAAVAVVSSGPADRAAVTSELAHGSESAIQQALDQFSPGDAAAIKLALKNVLDDSFNGAMMLLAIASLIGAILCALLLRRRRPSASKA